jgi:hypothetical protein
VNLRRFAVLSLSLVFPLSLVLVSMVHAQEDSARISGLITDQQKAIIRGAKVDLINLDTGVHYPTVSNDDGVYVIAAPVGNYRLQIEHPGFTTVVAANIVLHTQDAREINFEMSVGSTQESVTVNGESSNDSPAVSMTVDREFVENMPLNGESFQDLIQLAPGTASDQNGYYAVNGQRTESNNYTVDGVSANLGGFNNVSASGGSAGSGLSGASPLQTALGTTQSLTSVDSLQEFTIQTSGYTAEYGRSPGGQVQITTRSGTNDVHGTLFDYLRNTAFDANSFSNDYYGYPKAAEHQNDFGGTVSGPLTIPRFYDGKDRTFYFVSYEGLRLLLPNFESEYVPTQAFRAWASTNFQPVLNSAPLPNPNSQGNTDGCTIPIPSTGNPIACDALFTYSYSNPENLDNLSVRLDQNIKERFHVFARVADTPSAEHLGAEYVSSHSTTTQTWTAGATANFNKTILNELRFNSTSDREFVNFTEQSIEGSQPMPRSLVIPSQYDSSSAYGLFLVEVSGSSLRVEPEYVGEGTHLRQYQLVDGLSWITGKHTLKFGADWRRIASSYTVQTYRATLETTNLTDIQLGNASSVVISANNPGMPVFDNLSLYAQDHWQITRRLSLDYGLRWEFNPPPGPSNGAYPAVLTSGNLATATVAPAGTPPYATVYDRFAPRFGFAWRTNPSHHEITVRGGFGIFYDTGQSTIGNAYANAYPFSAQRAKQKEVPLPLSEAAAAPPSLNFPLVAPYPNGLYPTDPDMTLPYTEEWNLSVDFAVSPKNTLTTSYVGNIGRKLLFNADYATAPDGNENFPSGLQFTNNGAHSGYNALQVEDTGKIARGLDLVGSFTWAHSLDNASDYLGLSPMWGNSDYDLRRVLNLALNYKGPSWELNALSRSITSGWLLSNRFAAQSGYPLNITQADDLLPDGTIVVDQPDLVLGVPIYLHGQSADINGQPVTGSWRLNPAAFAAVPIDPTTGNPIRQGTLGRNYVRTPSFWALNTALQRQFTLYDDLRLDFRAEAFNLLNHPNYGNPDSYLSDSTFGQLSSYVNTIGSSNQLYAMGAARSLQLSLKLQF